MKAFFSSIAVIARAHLARVALSRRTALCLLGALVPAAIALVVQSMPGPPPSVEIVMYPGLFLVLQVAVPAVALIAGSAVVTEEIDDRTVTYLFTRPIPRSALLLGRWIATALVHSVVLALSVLLLALAASKGAHLVGNTPEEPDIPPGVVGPLLAMAVLGGAVYSALFATFGTFLKHPMIVGLAYTFTIEGFLSNLPGKSQALTIQFYLRSFLAERGAELWKRLEPLQSKTFDSAGEALVTLFVMLFAALALGSLTISRRQYVLPA